MAITIQQLLSGDNIGEIVDKINSNFSQIVTNGGGPQGIRGFQGVPGLPGLKGEIGSSGDAGDDGSIVTLVPTDPNWGVDYVGNPAGPTSAQNAINAGYNVGDIWVDNSAGVFYVIEETSVGVFEFLPYPLSPAALTNDFWSQDVNMSVAADSTDIGIRNSSRFGTLSLTTVQKNAFVQLGETGLFSELQLSGIGGPTYGYARPSFKLSIDQQNSTSGGAVDRVTGFFTSTLESFGFGQSKDDFSPILYLTRSEGGDGGFGFLHGNFAVGGSDVDVLTIASTRADSMLFLDVQQVGLSSDYMFFRPLTLGSSFEKHISVTDVEADGSGKLGHDNGNINDRVELWNDVVTVTTATDLPYDTNGFETLFGTRLTGVFDDGIFSIFVSDDTTSSSNIEHTATFRETGSIEFIDRDALVTPALAFEAKLTIEHLTGAPEKIAWFKENGIGNNRHLGIGITAGVVADYPMIYGENGIAAGFKTPIPVILQPDGQYKSDWIGFSDFLRNSGGDAGVGIGVNSPGSRLSVWGNLAIGDQTFAETKAPDWGAYIEGNTVIGQNSEVPNASMPYYWDNDYTPTTHPRFTTYGVDITKSWYFLSDATLGTNTTSTAFTADKDSSRITVVAPHGAVGAPLRKKLILGIDNFVFDGIGSGDAAFFEGRDLLIDYGGNITFGLPPQGLSVPPTAIPQFYNDVSDYVAQQRLVIFKKNSGNTEGIQILPDAINVGGLFPNLGFQFRTDGAQKGQIWNNSAVPNAHIGIYTNELERVTVINNGTVGIWEPNPTHRFVVEQPIEHSITVEPTSNFSASGNLAIYREGSRAYLEGFLFISGGGGSTYSLGADLFTVPAEFIPSSNDNISFVVPCKVELKDSAAGSYENSKFSWYGDVRNDAIGTPFRNRQEYFPPTNMIAHFAHIEIDATTGVGTIRALQGNGWIANDINYNISGVSSIFTFGATPLIDTDNATPVQTNSVVWVDSINYRIADWAP